MINSKLYKEYFGSLILLRETTGKPDQGELLRLRLTKRVEQPLILISEMLIKFIRENFLYFVFSIRFIFIFIFIYYYTYYYTYYYYYYYYY